MKILVDAMGGDNAPLCVLQGASQAAAEFGDGMTLALLGEEKSIRDCAKENKIDLAPFEIINCTENIDMHDDPVKAVRHKKDSSLVKGLTMLKNGEADAFVSAGSTGALLDYITTPNKDFQPMGANMGILPRTEEFNAIRDTRERYAALSQNAQNAMHAWVEEYK